MSVTEATGKLKLFNRLCALVMAVMLICQFIPYWHFGEGNAESVSISGYVWFPDDHKALNTHLCTIEEGHRVNNVVLVAVPILLLCAFGAVLCLFRSDSLLMLLFPIAAGLVGVIGYPLTASLRAGAWGLHVVLCAVMLMMGVYGLMASRKRTAKG